VSSSGHLQIAKELLGVEIEENLTFDVTLHAATVLSTLVVLWSEVRRLVQGLFSRRFNAEQAYVLKIVLSMIPIGIVGFALKDRIDGLKAIRDQAKADAERAQAWIRTGAQPTDTVRDLLKKAGV